MRLILLLLLSFFCAPALAEATERWTVYYSDKLPTETFSSFDTIVFDSDSHPPLAPLKAQGKTLLGYISLGEAEKYRSYFTKIKEKGLLYKANKAWKDHIIIDVRKVEWAQMVLDELIPNILAQGFDGIMIDTIDSVTQYDDMQQSAVALIKAIRARYPHIKIMLNRGFEILPLVAKDIDMVMAESTYTDWKFDKKKAVLLSESLQQDYLRILQDAQLASPTLKIYTIDYWSLKDIAGVKRIYARQRAQGFVPYVGKVDLQSVYEEPK